MCGSVQDQHEDTEQGHNSAKQGRGHALQEGARSRREVIHAQQQQRLGAPGSSVSFSHAPDPTTCPQASRQTPGEALLSTVGSTAPCMTWQAFLMLEQKQIILGCLRRHLYTDISMPCDPFSVPIAKEISIL